MHTLEDTEGPRRLPGRDGREGDWQAGRHLGESQRVSEQQATKEGEEREGEGSGVWGWACG